MNLSLHIRNCFKMKQQKLKTFLKASDENKELDPGEYLLYFDGGSRGNPGKAGAGAVIYDPYKNEIFQGIFPIQEIQTNNFAEYTGLIQGMRNASLKGINRLIVRGDSLLVIKQMRCEYGVKNDNLKKLFQEAKKLEFLFDSVKYEHIPRKENDRADKLSNQAMDFVEK